MTVYLFRRIAPISIAIACAAILVCFFAIPSFALAQNGVNPIVQTAQLTNPLNVNTISEFIEKLLRAVIQIGLPLAVLFIVLSGFKFIVAQGNPEDLATARKNFIHVVIGVAIFIGAWAIAQLIVGTLRSAGILN